MLACCVNVVYNFNAIVAMVMPYCMVPCSCSSTAGHWYVTRFMSHQTAGTLSRTDRTAYTVIKRKEGQTASGMTHIDELKSETDWLVRESLGPASLQTKAFRVVDGYE